MLTLKPAPEPFWLEIIPGQRTKFRPVIMPIILAAREEASRVKLLIVEEFKAQAETASDEHKLLLLSKATGEARYALTLSIAKLCIMEWEGVEDHEGAAMPVTPASVDSYLSNWQIFDAVEDKFVLPAMVQADEKNGSALSQNGTSGAKIREKGTAGTARKRVRRAPTK